MAADLVKEIIGKVEAEKSPAVIIPSGFSHVFQSYDCPKKLSEVVLQAVTSSISEGRLPILVCDLDETLVKNSLSGFAVPTDFYKYLKDSGAIAKSHGVLALTARLVAIENVLGITHSQLSTCTPEFSERMRSHTNLGGLTSLSLSSETRFLYDAGLLVMGENKDSLTKRQVLDEYLKRILVYSAHKYDLIFIDNCIGWFNDFCNGVAFDSRIIKGHFFHYNYDKAEVVISNPLNNLMPAGLIKGSPSSTRRQSVVITAGRFEVTELFDTDTDDADESNNGLVINLIGFDNFK